ncbi:hypothetical protein Goshw_022274 [Gossypium schwendimanii]|uniref:Uncharacterized protein n=1 Tax=Gossypium schwendimanii TaxID=34291 RepID=A0A7J9N487_GOSSC|nr:hypothetical protein [Gossypium schwendimanii]
MPGSTIKMVVQRVTADSLSHFKRYNVCFDALKRGLKVGCWLLSLLSTDLGLEDGYGYTIISDQQKIEISDILPRVEHRNCARQVFANWSGRKLRKSYECDFWQIVKCATEREWEDICSTLEKKDKDAYDNLMKKFPKM